MANKSKSRKDPFGRVLRRGEGYRKDRQLYIYQYRDPFGKEHTIYANNIKALREKEDALVCDRKDGIRSYVAARTSLNYAFDRYISIKHDLKESTKANYKYMYDHFVRETIGKRLLRDIRYSDIMRFYGGLIMDHGVKPMTVENVHTLLHPVFAMGVRDGVIRINPTDGIMKELKKSELWDKGTRHALTAEQTKAFMSYCENHEQYRRWYPLFVVFLGTGMRVGEVSGLRWEDVDFNKRMISVNHNLVYRRWDGADKECFHITTTKTKNAVREIPMMDQVYSALLEERAYQEKEGFCTKEVDGMSGFLFRNRYGGLYHQGTINRAIKRIYLAYNDQEILAAAREKRQPLLIPHFSCHHMRHTFCTRLCERENNVKAIQGIMGHADIQTTLDIYAEATDTLKQEAIKALQDGMDIF